jgi:hypothetical protein
MDVPTESRAPHRESGRRDGLARLTRRRRAGMDTGMARPTKKSRPTKNTSLSLGGTFALAEVRVFLLAGLDQFQRNPR